MTITAFPDQSLADESGLLAVGGDLEPNSLLLAYRTGIFPWPINNKILAWFAPPKRAILYLSETYFSKSFYKFIRKNLQNSNLQTSTLTKNFINANSFFEFKRNTNFSAVITACAKTKRFNKNTNKFDSTWITKDIIKAYINLHLLGYAESFETYENNILVGGLYGVRINNFFAGESMFHLKSNASKFAFYHMIQCLQQEGLTWIDCQVMNPNVQQLGAVEVDRDDFLKLLRCEV